MVDLLAPVETKAAWFGAGLEASEAWGRALTVAEISALERATEMSMRLPCPGFPPAGFAVPELAPLFAWMGEQLERGPGAVRHSK